MTQREQDPKPTMPSEPASSVYPALTDILDSMPFGVVILNSDYLIEAVNREGARLLGRRQVALFGQSYPSIWSAVTESDSAIMMHQLHTVAASQEPLPYAMARIRHGTSDAIPVQWTCQTIPREGRPGRFNLTIHLRDLSQEVELQEDRDRLAAMAEESPSPIIELDCHGHMLYTNPVMTSWLSRLGYRSTGLPSILPEELLQIITQCLQSGEIAQGREVVLPQASFTWTFCPITTHRVVRGYAIDMTRFHESQRELIHTAEQLQQTNRQLDEALTTAQESARTKSAFLAMMSHELRTPMNGVIGMTSLLMETTLSAEQRTYAETINQCGESLLHIINDVLECSKIEAGKLELERLDFNLRTTVESVLTQFAQRAEMKGLELAGLVHAMVPTALHGDPGRLRQVLTNLVGNALKFTEQGAVTLQAYLEQDLPNTAIIRFEVTDTGIGIAPDIQAKLFMPFTQGDSSMTRKYGGTGLGLMISKQLIELMGGQIGVTSVPGHGSTFWCTAHFMKQASAPLAILPSKDLQGRRVLIVDDRESNRTILRHLVTGWGMNADVASNAEEALSQIREASQCSMPYDLAIVDAVMPSKDGLQLTHEICHDPAGSDVRIIMLTSLLQRNHCELAQRAGAIGCCLKPVCHDQLLECLRTTLATTRTTERKQQEHLASGLPPLIAKEPLDEIPSKPRVLIVEDNIINQKVAIRMVDKLGYQSTAVGNGQEAIHALAKQNYALILMDCQMPIMDGFEATRRIREAETLQTSASQHQALADNTSLQLTNDQLQMPVPPPHIPIIALTANAMQGDRTHCLEIGMDDYLAKPIQLGALRDTLQRWITPIPLPANSPPPYLNIQNSEKERFDAATLFQNIGKDRQLFQQLITLFLNRHQAMLAEIQQALDNTDALAVQQAAHALKGTASNLCAPKVAEEADRLETAGHLGTLQDAPLIYTQLEREVLHLTRIFNHYRQGYDTTQKAA